MSIPLADQTDTSSFRADHWGDPNGPPDTAVTNGFLDAPGSDPMARSRQTRLHAAAVGSVPAGDQHLLNPGSAGRANKGSTSSIPYIDCSDVDSEQDAARGHRVAAAAGPRGRGHAHDSNGEEVGSPYRQGNNSFVGSGNSGGVPGLGLGRGLFGVVNGFHHSNPQGLQLAQQQHRQVMMGLQVQQQQQPQSMLDNRGRLVEGSPQGRFNVSQAGPGLDEVEQRCFQGQPPLHSTLLEEILQGRGALGRAHAGGRPLGTGTQSQCSSPVLNSFHHKTNSLSYGDGVVNSNQPTSPRWDDGGHYFSKRPGGAGGADPPPAPPLMPLSPSALGQYGSYSPIVAHRTPAHLAQRPPNDNGARNRSDTDPFILSSNSTAPSRQHDSLGAGIRGTSTPNPAPASAPTERRGLVTNGNHSPASAKLMVPGKARPNSAQRLYGRRGKPEGDASGNNNHHQNNLNQPPVQMIDGSSSSGTDTSDTESDTGSGVGCGYGQPLMYGNPAAVHSGNANNAGKGSPLNQSKFSFGSLQLEEGEGVEDEEEEEEEEEGCYRFTEEEVGGRVFSC